MLPMREGRVDADPAARDIDRRQLQVGEGHRLEVRGRSAIAGECKRLSIGRPGRLNVAVSVVRELTHRAGREVEQIEIGESALLAGEGDRLPIRRPRDVRDRSHAWHAYATFD